MAVRQDLTEIHLALRWPSRSLRSGGLFHSVTDSFTVALRASGDLFRGHQGLSEDVRYMAMHQVLTEVRLVVSPLLIWLLHKHLHNT